MRSRLACFSVRTVVNFASLLVVLTVISSPWGLQNLAQANEEVALRLQRNSVFIDAGNGFGSGSVIVREVEGERTAFVWTAWHVISRLRATDKNGVVRYGDVTVIQELVENSKNIGESCFICRVVFASPLQDIALLQVQTPYYYSDGIEFLLDKAIVPLTTEIYHCGTPISKQLAYNSLTPGTISKINMIHDGVNYDQVTTPAMPGSSGGIVALRSNGKYVGMLARRLCDGADSLNYIVPARRIVDWTETNNLLWSVDPTAPIPTKEQLLSIPVEFEKSVLGSRSINRESTYSIIYRLFKIRIRSGNRLPLFE